MELNNIQDLFSLLAESEMQVLDLDGTMRPISITEGVTNAKADEIVQLVHANLRVRLNEPGPIHLSVMDFIRTAGSGQQLNSTAEVLHFLWECGRAHQKIQTHLEALKQVEKEIAEQMGILVEEQGIIGIAKQIDRQVFDITEMVKQLPIPQFWPNLKEWSEDYNNRLTTIHNLITKLY